MKRLIVTKRLAPTDHRGLRVKASHSGKSITLAWDYSLDTEANHFRAVAELCNACGWPVIEKLCGGADTFDGRGYAYIVEF